MRTLSYSEMCSLRQMLPRNRHLKKMISAFIITCSTSSCNINPGKCFSTPRCTTTSPPSQWSWTRPAKAAAWPPQTAGIDLISGDVDNWGPWIYYFFFNCPWKVTAIVFYFAPLFSGLVPCIIAHSALEIIAIKVMKLWLVKVPRIVLENILFRALENGDLELAASHKEALENKQREAR